MQRNNKIYDEFLENHSSPASESTKNAYSTMHGAFEEYLSAIGEDFFWNAYKFGYECGVKAAKAEMKKADRVHTSGKEVSNASC